MTTLCIFAQDFMDKGLKHDVMDGSPKVDFFISRSGADQTVAQRIGEILRPPDTVSSCRIGISVAPILSRRWTTPLHAADA